MLDKAARFTCQSTLDQLFLNFRVGVQTKSINFGLNLDHFKDHNLINKGISAQMNVYKS